jgi:TorA maturation chaperone TorD
MKTLDSTHLTLASVPLPLAQEEQARADFHALIARLLLRAPDASLLAALSHADSLSTGQIDNPLETAWEELVLAAGLIDAQAVQAEFDALFISIGTPQVNPYASAYLAGFMMEKPLAVLRADLSGLGLARIAGSGELEDHLGALCETMRILISRREPVHSQKAFFEKHIASWYPRCLDDIRHAEGANFYRQIADFVQAFLEIEAQAFDMEEARGGECELE